MTSKKTNSPRCPTCDIDDCPLYKERPDLFDPSRLTADSIIDLISLWKEGFADMVESRSQHDAEGIAVAYWIDKHVTGMLAVTASRGGMDPTPLHECHRDKMLTFYADTYAHLEAEDPTRRAAKAAIACLPKSGEPRPAEERLEHFSVKSSAM